MDCFDGNIVFSEEREISPQLGWDTASSKI